MNLIPFVDSVLVLEGSLGDETSLDRLLQKLLKVAVALLTWEQGVL